MSRGGDCSIRVIGICVGELSFGLMERRGTLQEIWKRIEVGDGMVEGIGDVMCIKGRCENIVTR